MSRKSAVFHVYFPSAAGAVALNVSFRFPPGHSSLAAAGGATASIVEVAAVVVTVQEAAEQLPAFEVAAVRVAASRTNPAGAVT